MTCCSKLFFCVKIYTIVFSTCFAPSRHLDSSPSFKCNGNIILSLSHTTVTMTSNKYRVLGLFRKIFYHPPLHVEDINSFEVNPPGFPVHFIMTPPGIFPFYFCIDLPWKISKEGKFP